MAQAEIVRLDMETKEKSVISPTDSPTEKAILRDERTYGANEFVNKLKAILKGKYDKEISAAMGANATLMEQKMQSLILLEVLEELRKLNSAVLK